MPQTLLSLFPAVRNSSMPRSDMRRVVNQQFNPGLLGVFTNPFYIARRALYQEIARLAPKLFGSLLDIGCGEKPYAELFSNATSYTGIEFDTPHTRRYSKADIFYDGARLPFPDASFDSVLATEVLEHVFAPDAFLEDVRRITKPGGLFLLSAPFLWDEHEQPRDYARYTSFGLTHLLETHGFSVVEHARTANNASALSQLLNAYWYKKIPAKRYGIRLIWYLFLTAPSTLCGLLAGTLLPKNDDLYLGNVVVAKKI